MTTRLRAHAAIEKIEASAFTIPTDFPESDGTAEWDSTTLVVVEIRAGGSSAIGYSYADAATAQLIRERLASVVNGLDAMNVEAAWRAMLHSIRNLGRPGIAAMAISAVDNALWDLKAKILGVSLSSLLGTVRDRAPVYGSGGFTSYSDDQLAAQLGGWADEGIRMVKMKVGREPQRDEQRVRVAREAIGAEVALFVDANGGYDRKQALELAERFAKYDVRWFEEPVSSDDLDGLRLIRDRAPAGMDITAGEYGYDVFYFRRMLDAGAVDVLQADATRCCGITGFLKAAALCEARSMPMSSHCAPSLHVALGCGLAPMRHMEYFHDHVRIETMLFDGVSKPVDGSLVADLTRPGLGIELKRSDAGRFRVF